ncbi:MAG: hypothetical protein US51_C0016G0007 [Microgenomates group bacterium GW2011_GWA2_37_6]|nr:MAG: hypothetical protein US51_C0016G0007 [Microgenomates group bacterium GW2011_GWA2_37_6]
MANIRHKFKYKNIDGYFRPLLDITIRNGRNLINYAVLVDSGADYNIFHMDIARFLNLDLSNAKDISFGGIKKGKQGFGKGKLGMIDIGIERIFFPSFAIFSDDVSDEGYAIVGQRGFFENFKSVQFNYSEKQGYLK